MSTSFNISKHLVGQYWDAARNTANNAIIAILLKSTGLEADSVLRDYDTVALLLAAANDEADFTNYARKTIAGTSGTGVPAAVVQDGSDNVMLDLPDQTWVAAGGASNNTLGKLLLAYDSNTTTGTDANLVPLLAYDLAATTDGNDLILRFNALGAAVVA